jgi:multiple sugar transport system substrate-binding protein
MKNVIQVTVIVVLSCVVWGMLVVGAPNIAEAEDVVLKATLAAPQDRWDMLIPACEKILNENHPDMDISIEYEVLPYADTRTKLINFMAAGTERDLVSVDQIWLGEFAKGGFMKDITSEVNNWGRIDEFYEKNVEGSKFDGKFYGIWTWTDVRVMWYWKDLLQEAGVKPEDMATWDGYVEAFAKLEKVTMPKGIYPMHLVGAGHSPDMWFPYLWMNGGNLLEKKEGKFYPAFNSEAGVKALSFLQQQVEAGIKPQTDHNWGQEFADKRFAVMLEGSWLLGKFPEGFDFSQIGALPLFPTPEAEMESATMMGGWLLSIPATSKHPELAWELMTIIQDPENLTPVLAKFKYLPTQKTIVDTPKYGDMLKEDNPFFDVLAQALPVGYGRPNIPEYPAIAEHIRIAIEEVYYGKKSPQQALDDAAEKCKSDLGF